MVFQLGIKVINLILLAKILLFVFFNLFSGQFQQLAQSILLFLDLQYVILVIFLRLLFPGSVFLVVLD